MFPEEIECLPAQRWDDSEGGGIWDVHWLWVGLQRSRRALKSVLGTSGKCFISAQLDMAPGRRGVQAEPGLVLPQLCWLHRVRASRDRCGCFSAAKARSCTVPWAVLSLSFPESCAQATIPLRHSSCLAFF